MKHGGKGDKQKKGIIYREKGMKGHEGKGLRERWKKQCIKNC